MDCSAVSDDCVAICQVYTEVNLVDKDFHVDRISGVLIGRVGIVAGHAVRDIRSWATMKLKDIMTGITGVVVYDIARKHTSSRSANCRHEIDNTVGGNGSLAANFNSQPVTAVLVISWPGRVVRQRHGKRVLVSTITVINECPCGTSLSVRLGVGNAIA